MRKTEFPRARMSEKLRFFDENSRRQPINRDFSTEIAVGNIKIAVFQQNNLLGANKSLNRFLTDFCCLWSRLSGRNVINHAPTLFGLFVLRGMRKEIWRLLYYCSESAIAYHCDVENCRACHLLFVQTVVHSLIAGIEAVGDDCH